MPPHPDASTSLSTGPRDCPYCRDYRRRIKALVDESLAFDGQPQAGMPEAGDERKVREWRDTFDREAKEFREHREECNENIN